MPKDTKTSKPKNTASEKDAAGSLSPGKKAPSFKLADETGKQVALKELIADSNLVLYFYPKDMTPGCTTEACDFRDNVGMLRKTGARVVGISADSSISHQKFIAKHELNFPLLVDTDNEVAKIYGVYKMKSLYGRQYMGVERTTFIIDRDGKIRKVFPKVKVNGHTAEVLSALKELA